MYVAVWLAGSLSPATRHNSVLFVIIKDDFVGCLLCSSLQPSFTFCCHDSVHVGLYISISIAC